jgi:hypothetical protein
LLIVLFAHKVSIFNLSADQGNHSSASLIRIARGAVEFRFARGLGETWYGRD